MKRTDSSLVDKTRVEIQHALGRHAAVGNHGRVMLGDHPEQRVDLLQLQRSVEALALGAMALQGEDWVSNSGKKNGLFIGTHLEVIQFGRVEHAVLIDVAELEDPSQCINALRFQGLRRRETVSG